MKEYPDQEMVSAGSIIPSHLDLEKDEADEECGDLSEQWFEELLTQAIECFADEGEMPCAHIRTFEDAGVMTMNRGLVVQIGNAEFQLTIVRSR